MRTHASTCQDGMARVCVLVCVCVCVCVFVCAQPLLAQECQRTLMRVNIRMAWPVCVYVCVCVLMCVHR